MSTALIPVSVEGLHILQHSLGLDQYGQGRPYRNHFCTGPGSDDYSTCQELVRHGLMTCTKGNAISGGDSVFRVNEAGREHVALYSPAQPKLTRSQRNYQDFLGADCGLTFSEWLKSKGGV